MGSLIKPAESLLVLGYMYSTRLQTRWNAPAQQLNPGREQAGGFLSDLGGFSILVLRVYYDV